MIKPLIQSLVLMYAAAISFTPFLFFTGIWTGIPSLPNEGPWIFYMIAQSPGIVAFLFVDTIVFIAATILTVMQASQVID